MYIDANRPTKNRRNTRANSKYSASVAPIIENLGN
jgi:hypothetical protein